jgi:hypothetical protein
MTISPYSRPGKLVPELLGQRMTMTKCIYNNVSYCSVRESLDAVGLPSKFRSEKNSAEQTQNGFRYSAEKSANFAEFRVSRNSPFRGSERNRMERNSVKK